MAPELGEDGIAYICQTRIALLLLHDCICIFHDARLLVRYRLVSVQNDVCSCIMLVVRHAHNLTAVSPFKFSFMYVAIGTHFFLWTVD